jgi:hypothetical protein
VGVPARPFKGDLDPTLNQLGRFLIYVIDEEAPVMLAFPVRVDELSSTTLYQPQAPHRCPYIVSSYSWISSIKTFKHPSII